MIKTKLTLHQLILLAKAKNGYEAANDLEIELLTRCEARKYVVQCGPRRWTISSEGLAELALQPIPNLFYLGLLVAWYKGHEVAGVPLMADDHQRAYFIKHGLAETLRNHVFVTAKGKALAIEATQMGIAPVSALSKESLVRLTNQLNLNLGGAQQILSRAEDALRHAQAQCENAEALVNAAHASLNNALYQSLPSEEPV